MKKLLALLAASSITTVMSAGAAMAQSYPASVVGTWTIVANDTQAFTFTVQSQSSDSPCAQITGVIGAPNDGLAGYYCPATGAVSFLRNSSNSGATYQVYNGQLSFAGTETYLTGSFTNYGGNNTGAFSFSAQLP
jgi:hypothetical protein